MGRITPTQRTLKEMRKLKRVCGQTERWVPMASHPGGGFRKDLFGFIDLIVMDPEKGLVAIQSCGQAFSEHYRKITNSDCTEMVYKWLTSPSKPGLELWGWRKLKKKRGGKAIVWTPHVHVFKIEDLVFTPPCCSQQPSRERRL